MMVVSVHLDAITSWRAAACCMAVGRARLLLMQMLMLLQFLFLLLRCPIQP
jgi:hypothetical protein